MQGFLSSREGADLLSLPACAAVPLRRTLGACAIAVALSATTAVAQEKPAEIIAAHIRMQGYTCEKALSAQRNRKASRPDETVWLLRCSNGVYNVTLVPDLAAKVVLVKDEKQK
jgi:hypothetical protein